MTSMKQYSQEEEQFPKNPIAPGAKRYDFARYFTPNPSSTSMTTTTILGGSQALYYLFDFHSIRKQSKSLRGRGAVLLKDARSQCFKSGAQKEGVGSPLVTFHSRIFRSDVIKFRATSPSGDDDVKGLKITLRRLLKSWEIRDVGPIIEVAVPQPNLLGLPEGASLIWRLASDHKPTTMTLYSAGDWGTGTWSNILAQAYFSQSAAFHSVKLIAIETIEGITELLLIYTLISASIIESRLSEQHQAAREQQSLRKVKISAWTITPFSIQPYVL